MATLTLAVSTLTSSVTASDAKAAEVLSLVVQHFNGPVDGTNQEKLDFVVEQIVAWLNHTAQDQHVTNSMNDARETALTEDKSFGE